jgi:hypothetical protein
MSKILALSLLLSMSGFAGDITGIWKLNPQKSKNVGFTQIMKVEKVGNAYRITGEAVAPSGEGRRFDITRICDGKEHPLEGQGIPPGTVETCNPQTLAITSKTSAGRTSQSEVSFSEDGKTHTLNVIHTSADGKAFEQVYVYDRYERQP